MKCLDFTAYAQFRQPVDLHPGNAAVDGVQTTYRIQVVDGGYSVSGPLISRNLQVPSD